MAKTRPVLTPAQIEAGVQKNATEYENRVTALRALHDQKAYNPEMSPEALSKAALEAGRAATGKPAMALHGPGNEGDVRAAGRDAEAEALAKASGGRRNGRKAKVEEGESGEGVEGDARVPAREAAFGQQARPASPFAQAGNSHSAQPVGPVVEVVQAKDQGEAQDIASRAIEGGAISATVRVKYSVVVVRE